MSRPNRLALAALALILALAAYLRWPGLEHSPIGPDQSILLSIATNFVQTGKLPLAANKSSAGIINPPLIEYLIALPLLAHLSILTAVRFHAFLSLLTIPLLYAYLHLLFGRRVALLAALLLAASPWAVHYSRFLWNPNPIPFFATLLLGSLLLYLTHSRHHPLHLTLAIASLATITQLHLSSLVLIPIVALILLGFWRRWQRPSLWRTVWPLLAGLALAALLYYPYFLFERSVGFNDLRATLNALRGQPGVGLEVSPDTPLINPASFLLAQELAGGSHFFTAEPTWSAAVWPWFPLFTVARTLFIIALLYALASTLYGWRHARATGQPLPPRQVVLAVLALWICLPILFYLRHRIYLQNYYFLYLLPAPFILIALLIDDALTWLGRSHLPRPGRWTLSLAILLPLLLLCLWQINITTTGLSLTQQGLLPAERSVQDIEATLNAIRATQTEHPNCDLIILGPGDHVETSPLGLISDFLYPTPVRFVEHGRGLIHPPHCALYLAADSDLWDNTWLATNGRLLPNHQLDGHRFYLLPPNPATIPTNPLATWQNGLLLLDYQLEGELAPGRQLAVRYTWHVSQPPPSGSHYHFFNHFLDQSGQIVAQEDRPGVHTTYWQPGDRLITQFYLDLPADLPPGSYTLATGLYTWPDLIRIPVNTSDTGAYTVTTLSLP